MKEAQMSTGVSALLLEMVLRAVTYIVTGDDTMKQEQGIASHDASKAEGQNVYDCRNGVPLMLVYCVVLPHFECRSIENCVNGSPHLAENQLICNQWNFITLSADGTDLGC
jgi:hypothetical protein